MALDVALRVGKKLRAGWLPRHHDARQRLFRDVRRTLRDRQRASRRGLSSASISTPPPEPAPMGSRLIITASDSAGLGGATFTVRSCRQNDERQSRHSAARLLRPAAHEDSLDPRGVRILDQSDRSATCARERLSGSARGPRSRTGWRGKSTPRNRPVVPEITAIALAHRAAPLTTTILSAPSRSIHRADRSHHRRTAPAARSRPPVRRRKARAASQEKELDRSKKKKKKLRMPTISCTPPSSLRRRCARLRKRRSRAASRRRRSWMKRARGSRARSPNFFPRGQVPRFRRERAQCRRRPGGRALAGGNGMGNRDAAHFS